MRRKSKLNRVLTYSLLIFVALVTIYPILWVFKVAFGGKSLLSTSLSLLPDEITLDNFRTIFYERPS